jgi:FSR family fosmidomycin resistance protein-like MFS transporter
VSSSELVFGEPARQPMTRPLGGATGKMMSKHPIESIIIVAGRDVFGKTQLLPILKSLMTIADTEIEFPLEAELAPAPPAERPFDLAGVLTMAGGHLVHDMFAGFLSPLLPLLIPKLGLSLTLAGSLAALQSLPSLINPLLGMIGDRISLRWLAIVAPTITAVAMCLIGLAPTYTILAILLLVAGASSASWHVPSPVMTARSSGRRVGFGMSILMLGGQLAVTVGPLIAVAAASLWGLEGMWRLIPLGVAASLMLYWRTRHLEAHVTRRASEPWAQTWQELRRVVMPIAGIIATRTFVSVALATYLPTLLNSEGSSLVAAGGALSVLMLAGAFGTMATGTLSDRIGRRKVLFVVLALSPVLMGVFLSVHGWVELPALFALGFVAQSSGPVLMAMVQESAADHPATANGLYMALEFVGGSIITIVIGALADSLGLRNAFMIAAVIALFSLPFVLLLPKEERLAHESR